MSDNLNIPSWYYNEPDIWSNQMYRPNMKHIEEFVLGLGFKLESAHEAIYDGLFSLFFNIIAKTNIPEHYDCIRTWCELKNEKTIEWSIQIPNNGEALKLAGGVDTIEATKYKAELLKVLEQYKIVKPHKKVKEKQKPAVHENNTEVEQMSLF